MSPILLLMLVFVGVASAVGAVAVMIRGEDADKLEDRLGMITGKNPWSKEQARESLTRTPFDDQPSFLEQFLTRFSKLGLLFEQADTNLKPTKFFILSLGMTAAGWLLGWLVKAPLVALPFIALTTGVLPLLWLVMRRRKRFKKFQAQLPDALELISRALRAGHSLGAAFQLVAEEMTAPICVEFGRVFEEGNLGIPMEEALRDLGERIPNLDLKFFVTAVILQRQTGGDLAEILDKIGRLIRERFQIWGQVQALTGEGRLSGIVLLALPPALFIAVLRLNPDYVMMLFEDPMGTKMLAGAVVLQVIGALVIKKIINIKV